MFEFDDYERGQLLKFPEMYTNVYLSYTQVYRVDKSRWGNLSGLGTISAENIYKARKLFRTSRRGEYSLIHRRVILSSRKLAM